MGTLRLQGASPLSVASYVRMAMTHLDEGRDGEEGEEGQTQCRGGSYLEPAGRAGRALRPHLGLEGNPATVSPELSGQPESVL